MPATLCFNQGLTLLVLLGVLGLTLVLLLMANRIHRWIGDAGANVLVRVMGLILCALAAELVLNGIIEIFQGAEPVLR